MVANIRLPWMRTGRGQGCRGLAVDKLRAFSSPFSNSRFCVHKVGGLTHPVSTVDGNESETTGRELGEDISRFGTSLSNSDIAQEHCEVHAKYQPEGRPDDPIRGLNGYASTSNFECGTNKRIRPPKRRRRGRALECPPIALPRTSAPI